jgi:hypothetical protein
MEQDRWCRSSRCRSRTTAATIALALACAAPTASCVRQPIRGQPTTGLDRKLSTFAHVEDGELVTFAVDFKAARDRQAAPYVPLEIAVANKGLKSLTLSRESFTLVDANGRRYPMATASELLEGYDMLDFDHSFDELEGILFNRFAAFNRYPSRFSPTRTAGDLSNIVQDRIALPKFGYIIDLVHFPRPAGELRGQPLELFLDAPELEEPVFLKFEIR